MTEAPHLRSRIKPDGKVTLWFKADDGSVHQAELPAIDAQHALDTDAEHWSLDRPESADLKVGEGEDDEQRDMHPRRGRHR